MKIRVGDEVMILSGRDKGKTGKVITVIPKKNQVVVDGLNIVTKHKRGNNTSTDQGGKFQENQALNASKVGLVHPSKKGRTTRLGYKIDAKGVKKRIAKANGKEV